MTTKLDLVPASAGKRLGAAVLDWLGPLIVLTVTFTIGFAGITTTRSGGFIVYDTGSLVLLGGIGTASTLAYVVVLAAIEARTGNTIGNRLMGIRSTDADGYAPGGGVVFLRGLITGAVLLTSLLVAVVLGAFGWFAIAVWVLPALLVLGAVWSVLVVVSSNRDREGKRRGWHDKAAKSLAFDIKEGRNPVSTGGIQGPYSFAPIDLPPVQPVASPAPGPFASAGSPPSDTRSPAVLQSPTSPEALGAPVGLHDPNQWQPPVRPPAAPTETHAATPHPVSTVGGASRADPQPAVVDHPEVVIHPDDDERTQLRSEAGPRKRAAMRILVDDGQDVRLGSTALLGRNPAGQLGESVEQLLPIPDPGRSISKTHLHLRLDGDGVWITDRNSTNGSAVTTPDGIQTRLHPGQEVFVRPGSTVHFGDRSFHLGQA